MLTDKQFAIWAGLTWALVQVAAQLLVEGSSWSAPARAVVVLLPTLLLFLVYLALNRHRARKQAEIDAKKPEGRPKKRPLAEIIAPGWFVTFTSTPDVHKTGKERAGTAIAEVEAVEGENVRLIWRDKGDFPTVVPIKLLEATHVSRLRTEDGHESRSGSPNHGLSMDGTGGTVVGWGWSAHRHAPQNPFADRWSTLDEANRAAMVADSNLDTYDLG